MSDINWEVEEFWLRQDAPQPPPLWKEAERPTDEDTEQGSE